MNKAILVASSILLGSQAGLYLAQFLRSDETKGYTELIIYPPSDLERRVDELEQNNQYLVKQVTELKIKILEKHYE